MKRKIKVSLDLILLNKIDIITNEKNITRSKMIEIILIDFFNRMEEEKEEKNNEELKYMINNLLENELEIIQILKENNE